MNDKTNTEISKSAVERFVSLTITDKTKLTQQVIMFTDGETGHFTQQYELCADDEKTGVTMIIEGNSGKNNTKRTFFANGNNYKKPENAFIAAGHKWLKES
jgi:hypothetical protein